MCHNSISQGPGHRVLGLKVASPKESMCHKSSSQDPGHKVLGLKIASTNSGSYVPMSGVPGKAFGSDFRLCPF